MLVPVTKRWVFAFSSGFTNGQICFNRKRAVMVVPTCVLFDLIGFHRSFP